MADLWGRLARTLRALEGAAADLTRLEDSADILPALQYELHWTSELLAGVEPPAAGQAAHAELGRALVAARDATGDIAEVLFCRGVDGAAPLLPEWRGALFRVRLARSRLGLPAAPAAAVAEPPAPFPRAAAVATVLIVCGVAAFAAGAVSVLWPVWAGGLLMIALGCVGYRG
jgi:hypothetical protein